MPPWPGADDPVDIVVLGKSHHLGPGLLIRDAAGAAKVAILFTHEGPSAGPGAPNFGEGGSSLLNQNLYSKLSPDKVPHLGEDGGDAGEEEAGHEHAGSGESLRPAGDWAVQASRAFYEGRPAWSGVRQMNPINIRGNWFEKGNYFIDGKNILILL